MAFTQIITVDFSFDERAHRNDDRTETRARADALRELADGEPSYRDLRQVCSTYGRS